MTPREIRLAAGVSQIRVAVQTDTSEPTVRLYEANPSAIRTRSKRARLDAFYTRLEHELNKHGLPADPDPRSAA